MPNKFLKLESGSKLRALLASGGLVDEVVDFGDTQVFAGATNYTCILGLSPEPAAEVAYSRVKDPGRTPCRGDIDRAEARALPDFGSE
ncbi:MAG: hypothetical protein M9938_09140 [Solirubrobacterales bacterium]|nr:hypothetical protein [Solirubrobacterales bacterium]